MNFQNNLANRFPAFLFKLYYENIKLFKIYLHYDNTCKRTDANTYGETDRNARKKA